MWQAYHALMVQLFILNVEGWTVTYIYFTHLVSKMTMEAATIVRYLLKSVAQWAPVDSHFSWVSISVDWGKLTCSWIFNFVVLPKFAYKPIGNLSYIELLFSSFTFTHEIHENWYPTYNNESTVSSYYCNH